MGLQEGGKQESYRAAPRTSPVSARECALPVPDPGFTLIEVLIALLILSLGLLATGQVIFIALSSTSLARSQGNAALVAQDKLESLGDLCRRNPEATELSVGQHDGDPIQFEGGGGLILNRFAVSWTVNDMEDPRRGTRLRAKTIRVRVSPVDTHGGRNDRILLNKTVEVSSIFYTGTQ
jgi:prepilin-type N-terminal cleavage/methylation domain-containing protein